MNMSVLGLAVLAARRPSGGSSFGATIPQGALVMGRHSPGVAYAVIGGRLRVTGTTVHSRVV